MFVFFFFFQAEDGIRDIGVTGVQTCALPIYDLGFETVYDLIGGRAGWTALGLPTEGEVGDKRRISRFVAEPATVALDATIADVRALGEQRFPVAVVDRDGVLFGTLQPTAAALPADMAVRDVMV